MSDRFFPEGWDCAYDGEGFWVKRPDGSLLRVQENYDDPSYFLRDREEISLEFRCPLDECEFKMMWGRWGKRARCAECGGEKTVPWVTAPEEHAAWIKAREHWAKQEERDAELLNPNDYQPPY